MNIFSSARSCKSRVAVTLEEMAMEMYFLAAKLYESGKLSLGHAAELAGLSKYAFAEIIGNNGV